MPCSSTQRSAVRVSCQISIGDSGRPLGPSHATIDERWLVRPTAATSEGFAPADARASAITARVDAQISAGSCSIHCGRG